ncbi:adhesion G protein-coupled receptor G3 isoform X2 [Silurus meridionalis]|uniref:adhesion G protein-coupled receptor G3 isoform X2 n=1 Tax=Silurus meridionalis TaxID=175797 RepID=UPI001EEC8F34|nr:adhesion G protein-coupled receptor G3 isoform X2 [Silurus meridionalis]
MKWTCCSLMILLMTFWSTCVQKSDKQQCRKLKQNKASSQGTLKSNDTNWFEYRNCTDCLQICTFQNEGSSGSSDICQTLCFDVCSPCVLSSQCEQILLFDGGFTGQIQNSCNSTNATSNCRNIYNGSSPSNKSICILSFDVNASDLTNETCSFSDSGVWLSNNNNGRTNEYKIQITRDTDVRPTTPVCFVYRSQNCMNSNARLINCTQPAGNITWNCDNITCVDPNTICQSAKYTDCSGNTSNDDIITLNGSSAECYKCGNAFKKTEGHLNLNFTFPQESNVNYSDLINDLNKMVLKAMENKSSVSVSFNNISGIYVKPPRGTDFAPIYIMYSYNYSEFNIVEDKTQMSTFKRTFSVPKEAFEKAHNANSSTLFASLLKFPTFPKGNENCSLLNGEVYSIDMGEEISNLTNTFNLTFRSIDLKTSYPECRSWDGAGGTPNWTLSGCNTSYTNDAVTCECQHLTFFAVLMTPVTYLPSSDLNNLTYLTSIGCGLSLFFLSIALFMHFLLRKGRSSVSVHILISLFLALFLLNLSFLVNESVANTGNEIGCKFSAGVMHYSMLSAFSWFGLQALHLCLQLAQNVSGIQNYVVKLSILGWVPPALVVTATFIFQKYNKLTIVSDTKNSSMCWITDPVVHYVVNIGYYSIIFLFTFSTFVVMLRWLWLLRTKQPNIAMSRKKSRPSDALTIMGLCCILGLSWGFCFFAIGPMQIPALYIFTILNSLQGFFLFIYYYKSSRLVGEADALKEQSSYTTEVTEVENPYGKHKTI